MSVETDGGALRRDLVDRISKEIRCLRGWMATEDQHAESFPSTKPTARERARSEGKETGMLVGLAAVIGVPNGLVPHWVRDVPAFVKKQPGKPPVLQPALFGRSCEFCQWHPYAGHPDERLISGGLTALSAVHAIAAETALYACNRHECFAHAMQQAVEGKEPHGE